MLAFSLFSQLEILRKVVRNLDGEMMADNFRKLQDPDGREIRFNPTHGQLNVENRDSLVKPQPRRHW
jgi:hypothetical protein